MLRGNFKLQDGFIDISDFIYDYVSKKHQKTKLSQLVNYYEVSKKHRKETSPIKRTRDYNGRLVYYVTQDEKKQIINDFEKMNSRCFVDNFEKHIKTFDEKSEEYIEIKDFIYNYIREEYKNYRISEIIARIERISDYKKGEIKIQRFRNRKENLVYCIKENEKIDFLKMFRYTNSDLFYSNLSDVIIKEEEKETKEQEYINLENIIKIHISKEYKKEKMHDIANRIKQTIKDTVYKYEKFEIYNFKNDLGVTEYFVKKEDYEKVINFIKNTSSKIFDYKKGA